MREREIWTSLKKITEMCREKEMDLLLIAGDLFHRQPLLRELREVNAMFAAMERTQVVLCAGNHDYLKKDSYYRNCVWAENVHMILDGHWERVELPEIQTAVSGFSYENREWGETTRFKKCPAKRQKNEILMIHGGDANHAPFQKEELLSCGYDYVALGHIHKPQIVIPDKMAYSGALEPIDKNDTGTHGYILGETEGGNCHIRFVPFAAREYVHREIRVEPEMTGYELGRAVREEIDKLGKENIYKIVLKGFRNPDTLFDLKAFDMYGNIIEMLDDTKPSYNFEKIKKQNRDNILGSLIEKLEGYGEDSVEYRAMCEGVQAFMETRKG